MRSLKVSPSKTVSGTPERVEIERIIVRCFEMINIEVKMKEKI
jgi:hypothetical protein